MMPANKNWMVYKLPLMAKYPGIFSAANWLLSPLILKKHIQSHVTGSSGWLPPQTSWDGGGIGLPYGWEAAIDKDGRTYYVNHINKTSTYEDPRKWGSVQEVEETPEPREVTLERHPELGFGFVAGSERPVIVRFVTGGGPSVDKLMPGDQILSINGEDVARAPRDHVIQLVRNCRETVTLVVCQPPLDNSSSRKSALLSAAKKAKLKNNPSRVRFAESVDINGSPLFNPSGPNGLTSTDSVVPLMPNVLKVFLENGQTKSFKYDSSTTVQDVLDSLQAKLGLTAMTHFSLVVEHVKSLKRNKLTLLNPSDTLAKIASRPGAHNLRCLFRVTFVPRDAYDLLRKDSVAFEYLFVQCCNDVAQERFAPELKYEVALRLAALNLHQHAMANGLVSGNKVTVKGVEKECGLERFVPASLVDSIKKKELRKLLGHFLKLNQNLVANGQKSLTGLQAKLHYLKIISELPSYGAKCFSTTMIDSTTETVILVSEKFGISQIDSMKNTVPVNLCDIDGLDHVEVSREDEVTRKVNLHLKDPDRENIVLLLEERDAEELVLVLQGYYMMLMEKLLQVQHIRHPNEEQAPSYCGQHSVGTQGWNYPRQGQHHQQDPVDQTHTVDLGAHPPYHPPPQGLKMPVGLHGVGGGTDSGSGSDGDTSMISAQGEPSLDKNRNITTEDNANLVEPRYSTFGAKYGTGYNHNNHSSSSSNGTPPSILKKSNSRGGKNSEKREPGDGYEARNDEVIRRVAEMQSILRSTEQYLTDTDAESTMTEKSATGSERSASAYGKLRHSDSLLALAAQSACEDEGDGDEEEEDEITEPVEETRYQGNGEEAVKPKSVPRGSGMHSSGSRMGNHQSMLKHSDSSFGLHSPDALNDDVQMLLRKFSEKSGLQDNLNDRKLVLDPDLIDLTMIPPPMTPDEDGPHKIYGITGSVSTPPTPFADRETLEAELLAIEREIGSIKLAKQQVAQDPEEASLTSLTMPDLQDADSDLPNSAVGAMAGGNVFPSLAALRHLKSDDIDDFIANMAVPPPPTRPQARQATKHSPIVELTTEDISAFIIPPPPGSEENERQLYNRSLLRPRPEGDREIQELRVVREVREPNRDSSPLRIPTLQERIGLLKNQDQTRSLDMSLSLQKDRFGYPVKLSQQAHVSNEKMSSNQHQGSRYSRNNDHDKMTRSAPGPELDATSPIQKGAVQNKREMLLRQFGSPDGAVASKPFGKSEHSSDAPPPPPPRSSAPKSIMSQYNSNTLGKRVGSNKPKNLHLGKPNSSKDDMILNNSMNNHSLSTTSAPVHKVHVKSIATKLNNKMSNSSEDLDTKRSPISPSKSMSLASSSDSISSTASVNTVKSVSPADDNPPSLPPRASPSKSSPAAAKPPVVPPLASPESSDIQISKLVTNSPFRTGQLSPTKSTENGVSSPSSSTKSSLTSPPSIKSNLTSPTSLRGMVTSPPRNGISSSTSSSSNSSLSAASPTKQLGGIKSSSPASTCVNPPSPPTAPPPPPLTAAVTSTTGERRLSVPGSPKPMLPARSTKPSSNHRPSPGRALPVIPPSASGQTSRSKPAAPTPPASPKPANKLTNNHHSSPARHVPISHRNGDSNGIPPPPPEKGPQAEKLNMGRKLPVPPPTTDASPLPTHKFSSPAKSNHVSIKEAGQNDRSVSPVTIVTASPKSILKKSANATKQNGHVTAHQNGHAHHNHTSHASSTRGAAPPPYLNGYHNDVYTNSDFDPNDSLEGTSVDDNESDKEYLDTNGGVEHPLIEFQRAEEVVVKVAKHLQESKHICVNGCEQRQENEEKFLRSRDLLTTEARQFVTASKLFVKSATESESQLVGCLNHCVSMIQRIGSLTRDCAVTTNTPDQTNLLIIKVQEVVDTYLQTLQAAKLAKGKDMNDPTMNILMKKATALAGVLTSLMRSLRVFS